MDLHAIVARDGDGWLTCDVNDWLADKLGERDETLALQLETWADETAAWPLDCHSAADWARQRFNRVSGPGRDDHDPVVYNSFNSDNLLSENICVLLMAVRDRCDDMTLAVVGHRDVYVLDPMQGWTDAIDWSRAFGGCPNGHTFVLENACYLHSDRSQATHRLTEVCRLPDDVLPYQGGYVACPDCDHEERIEFHT